MEKQREQKESLRRTRVREKRENVYRKMHGEKEKKDKEKGFLKK